MKIQIVGDSFGLPRNYKNSNEIEIKYEDTYPEQLRQMLKKEFEEDILLINSSKRFNNSLFLLQNEIGETCLIQPEYLVIQVGIVDCWAREEGIYICNEFKGKNPWISESEYINNLFNFIESCFKLINGLKGIVVVNITKAQEKQYLRHLGSYENTLKYNNRLQKLIDIKDVFVVDIYEKFDKEINLATCSDGLHPSKYGNELISNEIFKILCNKIYYNEGVSNLKEKKHVKCTDSFLKVFNLSLIQYKEFWNSLKQLITIYINNKNYNEALELLLSETVTSEKHNDNEYYKYSVNYIANKIIYDKNIRLELIERYYFKLLDLLIRIDEVDLFNKIVSKHIEEYDVKSYEVHAELMLKYGLDDLATESFIKSIDLNTTNYKSYVFIAKKFLMIDEVNDALNFALTALSLNDKNEDTYNLLIEIYNKFGYEDEIKKIKEKKKHL